MNRFTDDPELEEINEALKLLMNVPDEAMPASTSQKMPEPQRAIATSTGDAAADMATDSLREPRNSSDPTSYSAEIPYEQVRTVVRAWIREEEEKMREQLSERVERLRELGRAFELIGSDPTRWLAKDYGVHFKDTGEWMKFFHTGQFNEFLAYLDEEIASSTIN